MSAYKVYDAMTPEQKQQFHQDWYNYLESFHDTELEKVINETNIEIPLEDKILYNHAKDFEIKYRDNSNELIQLFWYRKALQILFEKGFKYVQVKEETELHKRIAIKQPRALRSPNKNICGGYGTKDLVLFIKDRSIYAASGTSFYQNKTTQYFLYVGRILETGEAQQLSIFDFMEE